MSRPRLLDTFCCQGGASAGYVAAGFDVVGVDLHPQPRYPFEFVQADAIQYIADHGHEFDAIAGSPPCQGYSATQRLHGKEWPSLIAPTREAIAAAGRPGVIENVEDARPEMRDPRLLCGASFGLHTYRHRLFEPVGWQFEEPPHAAHTVRSTKMGRPLRPGDFYHAVGNFSGVAYARSDMGVPWMSRDGIRECVPPAYAQHIGEQLMEWIS